MTRWRSCGGRWIKGAVGRAKAPSPTILAVGLGRGFGGKSTILAEMVWRARAQGRDPIVADGDARSKTLAGIFPEATTPETEELPDLKAWLTGVLNTIIREGRSAVLDLGGGDRVLLEYGRDLRLVEFCATRHRAAGRLCAGAGAGRPGACAVHLVGWVFPAEAHAAGAQRGRDPV